MPKVRILSRNLVLTSAVTLGLTTGSAAAGYAVTNLANNKRGLVTRSVASTGHVVMVASFSARAIYGVALLNAVKHVGGSIECAVKNGGGAYAGFGGGTFSFASPSRTKLSALYATAGVTATDVRITFANTLAVDQFIELGGLVIADSDGYFAATVNITDDLTMDLIDPADEARSPGGQKFYNTHQQFFRCSAGFAWVSGSQKDSLLAIRDDSGRSKPVVVAFDPDDMNKTVFGRLGMSFPAKHETRDQWSVRLDVEEAV